MQKYAEKFFLFQAIRNGFGSTTTGRNEGRTDFTHAKKSHALGSTTPSLFIFTLVIAQIIQFIAFMEDESNLMYCFAADCLASVPEEKEHGIKDKEWQMILLLDDGREGIAAKVHIGKSADKVDDQKCWIRFSNHDASP